MCALFHAGCYAHAPEAHAVDLSGDAARVLTHVYEGIGEGGTAGRAVLREHRAPSGHLRELELDVRWAELELSVELARRGSDLRFEKRLDLGGVVRRWRGRTRADRLELELASGPGAPTRRDVPWGPSSVLDLGHPLAWGSWLEGEGRARVRAVRLLPLAPGGVVVDHFELEQRGRDASGRRKLWVRTRAGPVALWLTAAGRPAGVLYRRAGRGSPRVAWRERALSPSSRSE